MTAFESLWGEEFNIPESPKQVKRAMQKVSSPKDLKVVRTAEQIIRSTAVSIEEKLRVITENVLRILGVYKDNTIVIKTKQELIDYINKAISNGIIAIDTETNNSLDPLTCKLMGPCIYTPGMKNAYIPLNHIDPHTKERLDWQLTEEDIKEQFDRLTDTFIIMHNGKFDYQVIKCTTGIPLHIDWDTMIAARILDENELANLKTQYINKIDSSIEKYDIEHLFEKIEYALVDPEIFALYAATDAYMTYKLYEWQKLQFERSDYQKMYSLFKDIEMPIVIVAAEMELTGVTINQEYSERLANKYHALVGGVDAKIFAELNKYDSIIAEWRLTPEANKQEMGKKPLKDGTYKLQKSKNQLLDNPVNVASPAQLAILLYDILKVGVIDKETPRGTGVDILEKLKDKIPLCKLMLEKRGLEKLISTYIDKLPKCVSEVDGRLHAHFNQVGAGTGRFSSSDPNLQNIPSHEKSIRMMFTAAPGHVLVGSDFSQQEPRLLSHFSHDENMINAYKEGKDLYATIASGVYKNNYEDNLEHNLDGTFSPDGKKRRSSVKAILLGIMYGRGVASIAEQIGGTIQDAQKIVDDFYASFPQVKVWMDESENMAKTLGYVETVWGRRRRLPDIQLPKFEVKFKDGILSDSEFNPLLGAKNIVSSGKSNLIQTYLNKANECRSRKQIEDLKIQALKDNIELKCNEGFISQAIRQCVNARIQGSAADMSKRAMIKVHHDPELQRLGFKLLLAVHDELIGECPEENQEAVAERLSEVMKISAQPEVTVPFKCDASIVPSWYFDECAAEVQKQYHKLQTEEGYSSLEARQFLIDTEVQWTSQEIDALLAAEA